MRKSSRGNPYHYPKGSEKGGQFAPKSFNGAVRIDNSDEYYEQRTDERIKEWQADVIRFANPADDDYHTWIRSSEDIKTFSQLKNEIESEYGDEITPDYTISDYKKALSSGEITVYSSYDIKMGTFVTPSKMEAEAYGGGECCEMTVKTGDIAWLNASEGQYIGEGQFTDKYGLSCQVIDGNCHSGLKGRPADSYIRCMGDGGSYDSSKVRPIKNLPDFNKPEGGVWMSDSNADWGWTKWSAENVPEWGRNPETLHLKNARIFHAYSMDDIKKLPHKKNEELMGNIIVDWEEVSKDYDAFELHFSEGQGLYSGMYGWDCDSTVVFNPEVVSK